MRCNVIFDVNKPTTIKGGATMEKSSVLNSFVSKFGEFKQNVDETLDTTVVIEKAKVKFFALRNSEWRGLCVSYCEIIEWMYEASKNDSFKFCIMLRNVLKKVEKHINKSQMIIALNDFWNKYENEGKLPPKFLEYYYERWYDDDWFNILIYGGNTYKPFAMWMYKNNTYAIDISNLLNANTQLASFEYIIREIMSDDDFAKEVFSDEYMSCFLNSVWEAVISDDVNLTIEEAITTLCKYEYPGAIKILTHAYHYFIYDTYYYECDCDCMYDLPNFNAKDFAYILDTMADYEQNVGMSVFNSDDEDRMNLNDDIEYIILNSCTQMEVRDIVWILENRFGIDPGVIEEKLFEIMTGVYSSNTLGELLDADVLNVFFQFPMGYKLFMWYFDDIVKSTDNLSFIELEDEFDIVGTFVKA